MADNIDVTPGSGKTVRTDDVSGVQVQVVKIALGLDGAEDTLLDSGQQLMAASVPVAIASNQGAIPVTDNSTTLSIDDGAGSITVDGTIAAVTAITNALPAGTNLLGRVGIDQATANANEVVLKASTAAVGKLAANSGVDIGDVDVTTVAGLGKGQGTMANSLPVTLASDQTTVETKGKAFSISVTLTVTNGAYTIADVVGGLITFAGAASAAGKRSIINTITLSGVAALAYELWLFASDIATPAADNAAFTLVAADVAMCKGVISIAAGDYNAPVSAFNVATLRGVGHEFTCTATTLYGYLKATAVTSPGTTTLTLTILGEFID